MAIVIKKGFSRKSFIENKYNLLKQEYDSSWKGHHKELSEYLFPRRGRFDDTDTKPNDGKKRHSKILSGEASHSLGVLAAGLLSGLVSPARPWFRLTLKNKDLLKFRQAKIWLDATRDRILSVLAASNFYTAIHGLFLELGAFGTALMFIDSDPQSVIRCKPFTTGEYYINSNHTQRIDTMCRPFKMQAINLVNMFGKDKVSRRVRDKVFASNSGSGIYDWIDVVHFVEPNQNRQTDKIDNKNMPYQSVYYEKNGLDAGERDNFLSDSGFKTMPFMGIRWSVIGSDVYGLSPGMDALGDVKMLQEMERKYLAAISKTIDPPMNAPIGSFGNRKSTVAGGINYFSGADGNQSFTPTYQIDFNFLATSNKIETTKAEIRRYLHADLFQTLANIEKSGITAFEISKRLEEKRLTVGPLIERFHPEFADPAISRVFQIMSDAGMFSPIPPELEDEDIQVEIISVLAQAQKLVGTVPIEQTVSFASMLAQMKPDVLDSIDFDYALRQFSDLTGNEEEMKVDPDIVEGIRQARIDQENLQQQNESMLNAAQGAKTLSETDTGGNNALTSVIGAGNQIVQQ